MGIYPRFLRPIGPLWDHTHASCVRLVRYGNAAKVAHSVPLASSRSQGRTESARGTECTPACALLEYGVQARDLVDGCKLKRIDIARHATVRKYLSLCASVLTFRKLRGVEKRGTDRATLPVYPRCSQGTGADSPSPCSQPHLRRFIRGYHRA
eukprot:6512934-Pyramimonas_sp.AAC.1